MNQIERATNGSCQPDTGGSAVLPTHNSPAGDPVTQPKGGDDIEPGQPNVAGSDRGAGDSDSDSDDNAATINDPVDEPQKDGSVL